MKLDLRIGVEDKDELPPRIMDALSIAGVRVEELQRVELQWRSLS